MVNLLKHPGATGRIRRLLICLLLPATPLLSDGSSREDCQKNISRRHIIRLVEQYKAAIKNRDFETWRTLLSPVHEGSPLLDQNHFKETCSKIDSISVKEINGLTATLKVKYLDGMEIRGFLQMTPCGQIKYTPVVFTHPVRRAGILVQRLLNDSVTIMGANSSVTSRVDAVSQLSALKIPLCNYDPRAPSAQDRRMAARNILYWLEKNGETFDSTEPFIPIMPDEFDRYVTKIHRGSQ